MGDYSICIYLSEATTNCGITAMFPQLLLCHCQTWGYFLTENCTVELASYGYDDSTKHGYVRTNGGSSEDTYAVGNFESYRGVTLFELDATTCTTKKGRQFDTYSSAYVSMQLVETLESIMTGTIIVGVAADSAEHQSTHFRNSANVFFTSYYMSLSEVGFRDKFAFVMQKGYPQKTLFQGKPRYGESLRMTVALRGKLWAIYLN